MTATEIYRAMVAKPGLDSHDRGVRALATELTRSGFEVIYSGVCLEAESIARAAVDEDVDVICLSMHVGAHVAATRRVMQELANCGGLDIPVVCGGVIPMRDYPKLLEFGVTRIVQPRASLACAVEVIREICSAGRSGRQASSTTSQED